MKFDRITISIASGLLAALCGMARATPNGEQGTYLYDDKSGPTQAAVASRANETAHENTSSIPFEEFTLANGLRVVLHRDRSIPVVAINVWYHVGSKDEQPG